MSGDLSGGIALHQCPWCPVVVPEPPWQTETVTDLQRDEWAMRVTRVAWELTMLRHWRDDHPERYAELPSDDPLAEMSRELQHSAQRVAQSLRDVLEESAVRHAPGEPNITPSRNPAPPWEKRRPFLADIPSPTFEEFMRGWSGLH